MGNVVISKICGLCAGCKRAITVAEEELKKGKAVTIFKEIVHNKTVNNHLKNLGAVFADDINDLSPNSTIIIRAHGEPPETYNYLKQNNISFKDCTCPNVENIHKAVQEYSKNGYHIILLGKFHKAIHPEVAGTIGWANGKEILIETNEDLESLNELKNSKVYLVCQTTFNMKAADDLIEKIEAICNKNNNDLVINKSICSAQKSINMSSQELAKNSDLMIVVGGKNSSNSLELFNNIKTLCPSIFIEDINTYKQALKEINFKLNKNTRVGITAGASTMKEELEILKKNIENDLLGESLWI